MRLVSCRKCGKENIVGIRLCVKCGEQLEPAYLDMRGDNNIVNCTTCNNPNPVGATTCRVCGQPLAAATATPPPASGAGGSRLSRLAAARRQKEAAEGKPARDESGDWFSNLRSEESFADSYAASAAADAAENSAETVLLDRDDVALFASFSGLPAEATPQPEAGTGTDYNSPPLFATTNETVQIPVTPAPAEVSPPLFKAPAEDTLPDWLKEMNAQSTLPAAPPVPVAPAQPPAPAEEGLPDWLKEMNNSTPEAPAPPQSVSAAPEPSAPDVPDWLRETAAETPKPEPTPPVRPRSGQTTQFPPWLQQTTGNLGGAPRGSYSDQYVDQLMDFAFDEPITKSNPALSGIPDADDNTRPVGLSSLLGKSPLDEPGLGTPVFNTPPLTGGENPKGALSFADLSFLAESEDLPPLPTLAETLEHDRQALKPWLSGLTLPTMPEENSAGIPQFQLKPWLLGLALPAMPEDDLLSTEAPTMLITPQPASVRRSTGTTRPFSVSNLFDEPEDEPAKPGVPHAPAPTAAATPLVLPPLFDDDDVEPATEVIPFAPPTFEGRESIPQVGQPRLTELTNGETPDLEFELRGLFGEAKIGSGGGSTPPSATPSTPPPAPVPSPEPDLPDFLRDEVAPVQPATAGNLPAWMTTTTEPATAAPTAFDWLQESNEPLTEARPASTPDTSTPDWLQDLTAEPTASPDSQPFQPSQPDTDVPNWLHDTVDTPAIGFVDSVAEPANPPTETFGGSFDFLRAEAEDMAAEPAAGEEEIPDWLQALTSGTLVTAGPKPTTSYTPMSMGAANIDDSSIPDWLREEAATTAQPAKPEPVFAPVVEPELIPQDNEEVPDWLHNMDTATPAPPPVTPVAPARIDFDADVMPDWLQSSPTVTEPSSPPLPFEAFEAAVVAPQPTPVTPTEDFFPFATPAPDSRDSEVANMLQTIEQENVSGSADLPDWLQEKPATPTNEPVLNFGADLPDWLHENESASSTALDDLTGPGTGELKERPTPVEQIPPSRPGTSEFSSLLGDISSTKVESFGGDFLGDASGPAWLRSSKSPTAPLPEATPLESPGGLPGWLRSVAPAAVEEEVLSPAVGLASLERSGVALNTGYAIDAPALPSVMLPPELASTAVLRTLLTNQASAAPISPAVSEEVALKHRLRPALLVRLGLSIVLLLLALLALYVPLSVTVPPATPQVQAFFTEVESLTPDSKVLIVYDYEAERNGEMRPIAQSVTQHVLSKRVRLLNFSLNPQGPVLASLVTDELVQKEPYGNSAFYRYGTNYLNLGWRPGNEVAVRSLFSQLGDLRDYKKNSLAKENPVMEGINSLTDFDLIIILAGDESNVRAWVEQAGVQPGTQLLFGVPQAIEAIARPYAQVLPGASEGIRDTEKQPRGEALLAGLNQTYQYETLLRQRNIVTEQRSGGDLEKRVAAQSLAAIFLIIVVGGANIYYFIRRNQ